MRHQLGDHGIVVGGDLAPSNTPVSLRMVPRGLVPSSGGR
jgi:hypothetical protein